MSAASTRSGFPKQRPRYGQVGHHGVLEAEIAGENNAWMEKLTRMEHQAKLLQGSKTTVGWISKKNLGLRSRRSFFLDIPPQKQTQDCTASVIWRPSLAAFF
jgi:hypothetical protein